MLHKWTDIQNLRPTLHQLALSGATKIALCEIEVTGRWLLLRMTISGGASVYFCGEIRKIYFWVKQSGLSFKLSGA